MPKDFPKIQLVLTVLFLVISILAFFFFWRAINNNNQETKLEEAEWQRESSRASEMRALESTFKMVDRERSELGTHFAKSSDIVPFLDTIEALAKKTNTGAEFVSVNITKDQSGLLVEIKVSGTFDSIYKFLTLLENSPYELVFNGVEIHGQAVVEGEKKSIKLPQWNGVFRVKLLSFIQ